MPPSDFFAYNFNTNENADRMDSVLWDGKPVQVMFAQGTASSGGSATIVAAVSGSSIRLMRFWMGSGGTTKDSFGSNAAWHSSSAGAISPAIPLYMGESITQESRYGLCQTTSGEGLVLDNTSAAATSNARVFISYVLIPD